MISYSLLACSNPVLIFFLTTSKLRLHVSKSSSKIYFTSLDQFLACLFSMSFTSVYLVSFYLTSALFLLHNFLLGGNGATANCNVMWYTYKLSHRSSLCVFIYRMLRRIYLKKRVQVLFAFKSVHLFTKLAFFNKYAPSSLKAIISKRKSTANGGPSIVTNSDITNLRRQESRFAYIKQHACQKVKCESRFK